MAIAKHKTRRRELREGRALARRYQRGDRRAFELLYASYEGRLYRFCHRLTGSDAAAASLVEATFVRALATLPEGGRDALDMPAHLSSSARALAYERHTNGGAPWLDPVRGEHAHEVAPPISAWLRASAWRSRCAISRAARTTRSRSRSVPTQRLVAALVARARLRLRAGAAPARPAAGLPRPRGRALRATDGTLPLERRAELEAHVVECAGCRAALFALQEATLRYRDLPVPVPPGRAAIAHHRRARRRRLPHEAPARARPRSRTGDVRPAGRRRRRHGGARRARRRRHVVASRSDDGLRGAGAPAGRRRHGVAVGVAAATAALYARRHAPP